MTFKLKILCVLVPSFFSVCSFSQKVKEQKDSTKIFRKIEKYATKRKFTRFVYHLIFEPIGQKKIIKNEFQKIKKTNYLPHEGKIIRRINIVTLDPFGNSDSDSAATSTTFLRRAGNVLHLKTKNITIRNLLLIRKNERLDSLLIKESERLIRSQQFITSISTRVTAVSKDSVDLSIRVLDSWSLVPDFRSSTSKSDFVLTDKNFLGLGHEFYNSYSKSLKSAQHGYATSYSIPNFSNTYISGRISYDIDFENNYTKGINIERPFFSPYARWGAGLNLGQNLTQSALLNATGILESQIAKYNFQDYWAGHSYQIFKGNSEFNRATNLITNARYFTKNYVERPFVNNDSISAFESEKLYIIGVGISSRKFTQDKYVFNFNITEDIASGFVYSMTTGYQKKINDYQFYGGARFSIGNYFKFGYFSCNLEYGTFVNKGITSQSTANLSMIYFTNIRNFGKWKLRQFVKPQFIIGTNRLRTNADRLTLNGETGILGFENSTLFGTKKILFTMQTQTYAPLRLLGFRLNPFFNYTGGLLGNEGTNFRNSKLYSQISLGMILSNDFLVFNAFQFSFSYYPNIIDNNRTFKSNSISTNDFGLQDFGISKPELVTYK